MKKILLFALAVSFITCKGQQIYPLNTYYKDVSNYSYMKDLDNYLSPYVGIYKVAYQGNEITLYITQENKKPLGFKDRNYYQDVLNIKYIVKKMATGAILQENQNPIDPKRNEIESMGTNSNDNNSVSLHYSGTECGIGWGRITIKKLNATQLNWSYYPNNSLFSGNECPNSNNIKVYLPDTENLVFTKQ